MRVVFWNVAVGGDRRLGLLERLDADVLLLAEVSPASARSWTQRWQGRYHCAAGLELIGSEQQRPRGAMIASRWPLTAPRVVAGLPRPERGLIAETSHPAGPLALLAWSAPNAAGDGRQAKQQGYAAVTAELAALPAPVIAGVDTNTWEDTPLGSPPPEDDPDWAPEQQFIRRNPPHGLRDVQRAVIDADRARSDLIAAVRPHGPLAVTYIRRPHHQPRRIVDRQGIAWGLDRMDRLYASPDITIEACENFDHEAIDAGSDHALIAADLTITRTENLAAADATQPPATH